MISSVSLMNCGDEAALFQLLQSEEFDVTTNASQGPTLDMTNTSFGPQTRGLVLRGLTSGRLVGLDVRPLGHEVQRHGAPGALLAGANGGPLDVRAGPAHDPLPSMSWVASEPSSIISSLTPPRGRACGEGAARQGAKGRGQACSGEHEYCCLLFFVAVAASSCLAQPN